MFKTPEDFCQLVMETIRIYRVEMPKLLKYDVIVPMSYLELVEDYSSILVFKEKVDAWWRGKPELEGELFFNFHTDGGMRVTVTHYREAPIVSWGFVNTTTSLVARLVGLHQRMIGKDIIVAIPRGQLGDVPMCELFDRIALAVGPVDVERLCVTIKRDYLCVYMEN
jgi:hypothetical protein